MSGLVKSKGRQTQSPEEIFVSTPGGISILGELNHNILQFLTGRELLRFAMFSKTIERVVKSCEALILDAILEQIDEFIDQNGRQVNEHGFKIKNCVCAHGRDGIIGYCVRVTPKYVYFVREENIFRKHPDIQRVKNELGVVHVRPYIGNVVEVVQNWCVWESMTREFLD